jgi:hypothetical protein
MPIRNARQANVHAALKNKIKIHSDKVESLPVDPRDPVLIKLEQTNWEKELENNAAQSAQSWNDNEDKSAKQMEAEEILRGVFQAEKLRKLSAGETKQKEDAITVVGKLIAQRLEKETGQKAAKKPAGGSEPKYSSHDCVGNTFEREDPYNPSDFSLGPWRYRSCHFSDICYSPYRNEFLYFASPQHLAKEEEMRKYGHTSYDSSNGKSHIRTEVRAVMNNINKSSLQALIIVVDVVDSDLYSICTLTTVSSHQYTLLSCRTNTDTTFLSHQYCLRLDPNGFQDFEKEHIINQLSIDTAISALSTTWAGRNGVKWRPRVVEGPIPTHAEYDDTAKAHVMYTPMYSYNFGHLIPDEFAGIFRSSCYICIHRHVLTCLSNTILRLLDMFEATTNDLRVVEISDFTFMLNDVQKKEPCLGYYKNHFPKGIPKVQYLLTYCNIRGTYSIYLDSLQFILSLWSSLQGLFAWCSGIGDVDPSKQFLAPLRNTCVYYERTIPSTNRMRSL